MKRPIALSLLLALGACATTPITALPPAPAVFLQGATATSLPNAGGEVLQATKPQVGCYVAGAAPSWPDYMVALIPRAFAPSNDPKPVYVADTSALAGGKPLAFMRFAHAGPCQGGER